MEGMNSMTRKKKHAVLITALILLLTAVMTGSSALADQTGVVKGGWLILRATPSFSGTIRSSYPTGTVVTISGQVGAWYAVTAPDGLAGYMLGDYLQINGGGGSTPVESTAYVTSRNGLNVRLRSGPGKGYSILASYAPGTECQILSAGQNWCRIQIGSYTGYMMTQFLTTTKPSPIVPTGSYVISFNGKNVNLRNGPGLKYTAISSFPPGTPLTVVTSGTDWSFIKISGIFGYMMTQFIITK